MAKRSDASKKLRDELKASQVHNHVPSVDNSVAISKYFGHANTIYAESVQSYKKGEWRYAYVQFYIFLEFSFKLRKHNAFSLPQHMKTKAWMKRAEASALEMLEIVASRLDEIEDHARASEEEALIDEFFGSDDAETAPLAPPLSLNTSHEVSDSKSDAIPPISPPEICPPSDAPAMNVDDSLIRDANSLVSEFSISNTSSDLPPEVKPVDPSSASLAKAFSLLKTQDAPLDSVPPTLQSAWPAPTGYPTVAESDLLSEEESVIIHFVEQALRERMYRIPVPHKQELFLTLQGCSFPCAKDDFFVSFASFLPFLPPEIQLTRSAIETNRCFFIHLGVVTGFHPYILQSYFRYFARKKLLALSPDDMQCELLKSVLEYAGFVDANVLCLIWPREFSERRFRICFLCGSLTRPMFIVFTPNDKIALLQNRPFSEIVLYCDGSHFTILGAKQPNHSASCHHQGGLRPTQLHGSSMSVIDQIISHAREAKLIVQEHFVESTSSIEDLLIALK